MEVPHSLRMPIIQRCYTPYAVNEVTPCVFCKQEKKTVYRIEYFDDLEYAVSRILMHENEDIITGELWRRIVNEQRQGIYTCHATLYGCIGCVLSQMSSHFTGRNPVEIYSMLILLFFRRASIVLVRYTDDPSRLDIFYNEHEHIEDFASAFQSAYQRFDGDVSPLAYQQF